jgi:hypothetical protein
MKRSHCILIICAMFATGAMAENCATADRVELLPNEYGTKVIRVHGRNTCDHKTERFYVKVAIFNANGERVGIKNISVEGLEVGDRYVATTLLVLYDEKAVTSVRIVGVVPPSEVERGKVDAR